MLPLLITKNTTILEDVLCLHHLHCLLDLQAVVCLLFAPLVHQCSVVNLMADRFQIIDITKS
ncbi:MAG: hypothetical protein K0S24_2015 [Sphingobacterium sp.]|jgi:hypothetical protein|nr:hypothetical protein [Sphingobacterium sp.]